MSLSLAIASLLAQEVVFWGIAEPQIPARKSTEVAFCNRGKAKIDTSVNADNGLQLRGASWRGKRVSEDQIAKFNADTRIRSANYITFYLCRTQRVHGADGVLVSVYGMNQEGKTTIHTIELSGRGLIWKS